MPKKNDNYEEMMESLKCIVSDFEDKDIDLDEAMKKYEAGLKIINKLYKTLNAYEGKIKIIDEKYGEMDFKE